MSFVSYICIHYEFLTLIIIAGFCENSLGYVERLNVDKMEWEELS